jgi:integrase
MATFKKRPSAKWPNGVQATVSVAGAGEASKTLPNMREAKIWAAETDAELRSGLSGQYPKKTLGDALDRYEKEVSVDKRGKDWESVRIAFMKREFPELWGKVLHKLTSSDWSAWRDARLRGGGKRRAVSKGTVQREINLFRNVWMIAFKEWRWCGESPFAVMRMPGDNPARERVANWRETRLLLRRMGYITGQPPRDKTGELAYLYLLALGTAMRTSELLRQTTETVDAVKRVLYLDVHKTLEKVGTRYVPLPRRTGKHWKILSENASRAGRKELFTLSADSADALFRKYRDQLMIEGLTFRDTRATALTLLSRRTDVMTLSKISGHKDIRVLQNTYYRERPEDIAARI